MPYLLPRVHARKARWKEYLSVILELEGGGRTIPLTLQVNLATQLVVEVAAEGLAVCTGLLRNELDDQQLKLLANDESLVGEHSKSAGDIG